MLLMSVTAVQKSKATDEGGENMTSKKISFFQTKMKTNQILAFNQFRQTKKPQNVHREKPTLSLLFSIKTGF